MPKGESFFGKFESIWNKTNLDKERGKDSLSPEEKKRIEEALGIIGQANEWSGDMEDKKRYLEAVERIISLGRKALPFLKEKLTDSKRSTEHDAFLLARFFSWIGTADDVDLAIDVAKKRRLHTFNDLSALSETATFIGSVVYEIRSKNPTDPRLIPIAIAVRDMAIEARKSTQKMGVINHDFEAALSHTGTPQAIEYLTKNSDTHYLLKYAQNIQNIRDFSVRRERFKTWKETEEEQHTLARRRTENKDRDQYAYYREETDDFQNFEDEMEYIDDETTDEDDEYEDSAERSEEANKRIEMLLDIFEKVAAIRNQRAQRREQGKDANYEFFPYEQERKELFEYCSAIAEYLKAEKISNLVIIDRSSRPLYVGVKEYLRQKYPNDRGPNMYFLNPLGFKTEDNLTVSEARNLIYGEGFKGDLSVTADQIRSKEEIFDEFKKAYPKLLKDKEKPVLVFDTCLHSGNTLRPVTESLRELGFTDARVGSVNPSDAHSSVRTDFYITTQLPEKGCYPFDRDRMVEKTLDHVYSKRTDEPVKRLAARRLREEVKKIMQEQLSNGTPAKTAPGTHADNLNPHHHDEHRPFSRPKRGGGH